MDKQALKRQLKPEDVARLVLFLSSDQSSGCTKQSFVVDGGITWSKFSLLKIKKPIHT